MPKHAPEFSDSEKWVVAETLKERWQDQTPELREVETEIRIYPDDRELTDCSGLYWESGKLQVLHIQDRPFPLPPHVLLPGAGPLHPRSGRVR